MIWKQERPGRFARGYWAWVLPVLFLSSTHAAEVPSPESQLGYKPGADFHLAAWNDVVKYFKTVDDASDRVTVRTLGETTEGRPLIAAFVSISDTIPKLDDYKAIQSKLSDPRKIGTEDSAKLVADGKPVVVISCSIHSVETASTLMAMELLHELATGEDEKTKQILDSTILILIPSANPDGVDEVAAWYERSKGHPWEGSGLPKLYHKYAGHDTNRDWFMLNLKETQLLTKLYYKEWFPTILYDVHQMGSRGARLFVPPFYDPINPNLDPRMNQGIFMIGAHMASDLAAHEKKGILTNAMYDNWWNGGNRTVPQRHNIVAVLTEAASVKMASPIFLEKEELRGITRGFKNHEPAVNFVDPWLGGWWRLRDIVDYELICCRSLLTLAARYRDQFQGNLLAMARSSIEAGTQDRPSAWIVPKEQRDPGSAATLVRILQDTGIEVREAENDIQVDGRTYPAGTWILPAAQPYRGHLKDMMERQVYPTRLLEGGKAEAPYDVAGWTLPLQMGVRVVEAAAKIEGKTKLLESSPHISGGYGGAPQSDVGYFLVANTSNDDFRLLNALLKKGVEVDRVVENSEWGTTLKPMPGSLKFPSDAKTKEVLDEFLPKISSKVERHTSIQSGMKVKRIKPSKIGLYQPWIPSMDEGWTRYTLEAFDFPYQTIHNAEIRAGRLKSFIDILLIPSIEQNTLMKGYGQGETEPAFEGGLGQEGVASIREFIHDGGRLVCLDASSDFAIEALNLPVKNVLKGLSTADFYAPGSILRAELDQEKHYGTWGVDDEVSVYFDHSAAFETTDPKKVTISLRYAASNPLESGWLLGPGKLAGKGAIAYLRIDEGEVVLFGFPPQHRAQTHGTFRLLFNALIQSESRE